MLNIFIKFAYFNTTLLLTKPNMSKIKSLDELRQMKARLESEMDIREKSNNPDNLVQIRVAMATCGIAAGARTVMNAIIDRVEREKLPVIVTQGGCMGYCYAEPTIEVKRPGEDPVVFGHVNTDKAMEILDKYVLHGELVCRASESVRIVERLREEIAAAGMDNDVQVVVTGCFGFCEKGPIVKVIPDNTFYTNVKPEDAEEIVKEHVVKGRKVTRLLYEDPDTKKHISDSKHMGFYQKQLRIALRNCGFINPDLKWEIASKSPGPEKYVVCNADEGDPGAFMDRSILESDPNSVIEAMAICGYCIGASKGLVYIRAEYPLAVKRLQIARPATTVCSETTSSVPVSIST